MDFYTSQVGFPERCPDCDGKGRKPYPNCFYPCHRCAGSGKVVKLILTYPESYDSGINPIGRMMYAGEIEMPYLTTMRR